MRKGTKIFLFTGLGIFATGILICMIAFAVNGFRRPSFIPSSSASEQIIRETVEKEIAEEFDNIQADVISSNVRICRASDGVCRIEYEDDLREPVSEVIVEKNTLIFRQFKKNFFGWKYLDRIFRQFFTGIRSGEWDDYDKCTIFLPEKVYDKLDIQTVSGNITMDQELTFSKISLGSVSGNIGIQNVTGVTCLNIETTSGEIEAGNMTIDSQISASSVSGEVRISRLTAGGKAVFSSVSGQVSLKNSDFLEIEAETQSGDIYIVYSTAEKLKATTVSGEVFGKIDADINVHGTTLSGSYKAPSGSRGEWNIETVSGDIRLDS